jgi:hypothetical protein
MTMVQVEMLESSRYSQGCQTRIEKLGTQLRSILFNEPNLDRTILKLSIAYTLVWKTMDRVRLGRAIWLKDAPPRSLSQKSSRRRFF